MNGEPAGSAAPLNWSAGVVRAAVRRHRRRARSSTARRARSTATSRTRRARRRSRVTSPADQSAVTRLAGHRHRARPRRATPSYVAATNTDDELGDDDRVDDRRRRRRVQRRRRRRPAARRVLNVVAVSPSGGTAHVERIGRLRLRARHAAARRRRSGRRRQRPRQLRLPDVRATSTPARSTCRSSRSSTTATNVIFRRADARPDADVRQPARRAARRRLRARSGARADLDRGRECVAQLPDRAGVRVEPPDPGAGLRPALRGRVRARPSARSRSARTRSPATSRSGCRSRASGTPGPGWAFTVVLTGQDGFSRRRPGARLPADAAGLPVRRLRDREHRPALHGRPGDGPEGDRRAHAGRRRCSRTSSTTRCTTRSSCRASRSPSAFRSALVAQPSQTRDDFAGSVAGVVRRAVASLALRLLWWACRRSLLRLPLGPAPDRGRRAARAAARRRRGRSSAAANAPGGGWPLRARSPPYAYAGPARPFVRALEGARPPPAGASGSRARRRPRRSGRLPTSSRISRPIRCASWPRLPSGRVAGARAGPALGLEVAALLTRARSAERQASLPRARRGGERPGLVPARAAAPGGSCWSTTSTPPGATVSARRARRCEPRARRQRRRVTFALGPVR